jgi:capsular exopolysaccharide synthesis family protein
VLWRGRYTALGILLLVVGVAVLRVMLATPIYKATAVVEISPEARRILPGQEQWVGAEGRSWIAEEFYFNTQREILKSRDLAGRVFRQLHLEDHPRFAQMTDPVGAFAGLIEVRPRVSTRLVEVSMSGPDPKEVTEWTNALAQAYVRHNVDAAAESFTTIMDEIRRGLGEFRTSLGEADEEILQTAADQELFVPENQQSIIRGNLDTYNKELATLRMQIGSLGTELESLERIRREGGDVLTLSRFSEDGVMQDLSAKKLEIERELERLASEKTPRHPDYLVKETELEKVVQKIDEQIARIAKEVREEYNLARSNAAGVEQEIRRTEVAAYKVDRASTNYELLKTDAQSKRRVYDLVAETMERLSVGAQLIFLNNNVSILDKAIEPRHPISPRKRMTVALSFVMGLLLGVGTVLFLDYLDNTIRSPEEVEENLGLGVLAMVPKFKERDSNAVREAFQTLRTSVLFSSQNREKKLILVTSAGPQEGKSTTVAQIGRTLASAGDRVMVLDCDLRRPTQDKQMGVPREPGLTNYMIDGKEGNIESYVRETDVPQLHVMPSGPIPPNPAELLGQPKFAQLLANLKTQYDWIIVDCPPVANLADPVVLATLVDMMLLVIKNNENDQDLIRRCLNRLRDVEAPLAGAVLNAVDMQSGYYGKYGYAYDYYESDHEKPGRGLKKLVPGSKRDKQSRKIAL